MLIRGFRARDKQLRVFGRAALPRRPRIRAERQLCHTKESEEFCPALLAFTMSTTLVEIRLNCAKMTHQNRSIFHLFLP